MGSLWTLGILIGRVANSHFMVLEGDINGPIRTLLVLEGVMIETSPVLANFLCGMNSYTKNGVRSS